MAVCRGGWKHPAALILRVGSLRTKGSVWMWMGFEGYRIEIGRKLALKWGLFETEGETKRERERGQSEIGELYGKKRE